MCNNLKEVFEKFRPSFSAELESAEGEPINAEFEIKAMKDFTPKQMIENNDYLQKTYYSKEMHLNRQGKEGSAAEGGEVLYRPSYRIEKR